MAVFGDFHVLSVSKRGSPSSRSSARLVLERPGLVFWLRSRWAELPPETFQMLHAEDYTRLRGLWPVLHMREGGGFLHCLSELCVKSPTVSAL